jgi:nucleotide sugar dehydrogenase
MGNKKNINLVSIVGLGYVGLPLALLAAENGYRTCGVDLSEKRLKDISEKRVTIDDVCASKLLADNQIMLSIDCTPSDIFIICVPTPVNEKNEPNLDPVVQACEMISKVACDGNLVIIESTIYPGMCEEIILPIFKKHNKNILLAHCPERINPGDKYWSVENIPRVIGGINSESCDAAFQFYKSIIKAEILLLAEIKTAEATKILENIFRDVNIALVNEMSQAFYRMGIDAPEVIAAASTKPFGFMPHWPGIGVGGHCIAVDPYYMIEKGRQAGFDHEFLKLARKINSSMPIYTTNLIQNSLNSLGRSVKDAKIGIYGLSYKPDVADIRESPSFEVIRRLQQDKYAKVCFFDPQLIDKSSFSSIEEFLRWSEVLVVCTAHTEIKDINYDLFENLLLIVDGRNCLQKNKIKEMGIMYRGIGSE